ncbi:twin-arginine translocation signal domain-containing protein [Halogeometricum sp. S1BR25-6]|uniref:Twin-arginine translocation signal domain-containing protein n=1 Tax=Halogeometricum salsisoli TaxID=2950536 RepID=A0ABU2G8U5_9EURY|nr:FxLYD domain-containing protein [Halogeometricum sp. S1BR25-6]MDS0297237.1 twin-arginine translocation signal domain-containing protein [Halogeometricum sp. S1BR25-6]
MFRRKFLKAAGASGVAGLAAGCMGGEQSEATEAAGGTTSGGETATETATETETETTESTADGTESGLGDVTGEVGDTPEGLEVASHNLYAEQSAVGLRGTVENTSEEGYRYVQAQVTLQDDQGDVLYEFFDETEQADTVTLQAGESWDFDVLFEEADDLSAVTAYTVDLAASTAGTGTETGSGSLDDITGETDQQDPNLEITSHELTREESTTYVTGTVENAGEEDIESVEVSVTLYDAEDQELFDFRNTVEEEEDVQRLAPGESWNFRVQFPDIDMQRISRYVISADSDIV